MATEQEGIAGLTVLLAVARADGTLASEEREALESALREHGFEDDVDTLVSGEIDLDAAIEAVSDQGVRRSIYLAAASMALADGAVAPEEEAVLARIRKGWSLTDKETQEAARLAAFADPQSIVSDSALERLDTTLATEAAQSIVQTYSLTCAAIGAIPIPLAPEITQLFVQNMMMDEILRAYDKELTTAERAAVTGAALGLGFARIGIGAAMKLLPIWGSVVGLATGYIGTWAFGTALYRSIESGKLDAQSFKAAIKDARKEGKAHFDANKADIQAQAKAREGDAKRLADNVSSGDHTPEAMRRDVANTAK